MEACAGYRSPSPFTDLSGIVMFYDILSPEQQKVLPSLKFFKADFYLAGGTALALQIGHRDSIDFDFFCEKSFVPEKLIPRLKQHLKTELSITQQEEDTLTVVSGSLKISFLAYPYLLIENLVETDNLRLASIADIGCMKLSALMGRATLKDYADLYFILQRLPLADLLETVKKKYAELDVLTVLKGLVFFEDIEPEPLAYKITTPPSFEVIKDFLAKETKKYLTTLRLG